MNLVHIKTSLGVELEILADNWGDRLGEFLSMKLRIAYGHR